MSHSGISYTGRGALRIIGSCVLLLMFGAIALAGGSTAKRGTKPGHAASRKAALAQTAPPTLTKFFSQALVGQNGTFTMGFTIGNDSGVDLTGVAFSDTLPAGLVIATPNNLANGCGGTATATPGSSSFTLTGATVTTDGCAITVDLVATGSPGVLTNTTSTITSNETNPGA